VVNDLRGTAGQLDKRTGRQVEDAEAALTKSVHDQEKPDDARHDGARQKVVPEGAIRDRTNDGSQQQANSGYDPTKTENSRHETASKKQNGAIKYMILNPLGINLTATGCSN
jgi:hypothetical protein